MKSLRTTIVIGGFMLLVASASRGQDKREIVNSFDVSPVALDSENTTKTSLGVEFDLKARFVEKKFSKPSTGPIDPNARRGGASVDFALSGTATQNAEDNPKDLIETKLSGQYFSSSKLNLKAGGFVQYETDQSLEDKQLVYGGTVTLEMNDLQAKNIGALYANVGQVDPSKDTERQALLGTPLDKYTRASVELFYSHNIGGNFDTFEIDYKYYKELSPPAAIEAAGADTFKLATYRLGFMNNLFIAYATGKVPFDRTNDQIVELGFSYKLK